MRMILFWIGTYNKEARRKINWNLAQKSSPFLPRRVGLRWSWTPERIVFSLGADFGKHGRLVGWHLNDSDDEGNYDKTIMMIVMVMKMAATPLSATFSSDGILQPGPHTRHSGLTARYSAPSNLIPKSWYCLTWGLFFLLGSCHWEWSFSADF